MQLVYSKEQKSKSKIHHPSCSTMFWILIFEFLEFAHWRLANVLQ